jgi:hypothetical protein
VSPILQDRLLEQSQALFDKKINENFTALSQQYLKNIKDEINRQMNGLMLMNLQGLSRPNVPEMIPTYQIQPQ